ncbi:site-2 protease family protein [bacterium (Candidatus Blackallbacteria) CG17_big_fil_post_rev_8_21_14_2_50_48_46]|uniref:Site-2 protease family protein n=1 Tax=bacterium (Candidatus Blackallbacteria) CG17_big_fil_post_rev_8_21_14_2_50_48_46 TaxID=2014261 RepID=A0A2M7FZS3_9BACT|nr:MAG: site-2 protease family protein [bacterium (Candidatus Blackallbacteria) CG18_big_fil_WC_8_21_14_2_50_49_26]PIW14408.1 MAG: site-2 protease family protein [bacterium (Candidatus Blackallbacteria) CG17_big_fil_post_rev_8_21_14_2_50_48_46]PIW46915.1 MAG: site-2 protease family protein [bacterium (Candidatus Blackallbacteria) CG13_big_fil_rev_8_21_14_2_50_49_14]
MIFRSNPLDLLILLPLFIISISFHEAAHAYAAHIFGDDTAAREGRLTLNPIAHLDLMGALMVVFVGFGWAKPVPVDPRNLRNPAWQMPAIAAAGPLANLLLAILSIILLYLGNKTGQDFIKEPLVISISLNLLLMVFNLVPLPPLDGAGVLRGFLPRRLQIQFDQLLPYGPAILIALVFLPGVRDIFFGQIYKVMQVIFEFLVHLFSFLA